MVKFILIKSADGWATTKQAWRDELVVYLFFSPQYILRLTPMYWALFYGNQILHFDNFKPPDERLKRKVPEEKSADPNLNPIHH